MVPLVGLLRKTYTELEFDVHNELTEKVQLKMKDEPFAPRFARTISLMSPGEKVVQTSPRFYTGIQKPRYFCEG